jgi:hypothetical protein|nr:MAG TPA: hypothetical protein [Caudoviricetes sp.]
MNLNTGIKPINDSAKTPCTRPLYVDGILYWYLDSRSDDYPNEIIQDIVNGIVNEYNLLDLDKMYRKLVYPNANYIELPIHVGYSSYTIMCAKFDDAELQEKLEKDRELLKVADVEIYKLINRIVTKLEKQTSFGFIHDNTFGDDHMLHIKASKYASFILSSDITRYINVNTCGNDKVITVWLKDKDGEFYLPSFTVPEVEYEYLAPFSRYNEKYCNKDIAFTVKPGRNSYVNIFESPYDVERYLKNINYTGEYCVSVTDISNADLSKYVLTNLYISRELIEPLRDDNSVTLSVDKDIRNINDIINKMLNQQSEIEEHTLSDYVDVFISLGVQSKIFYGLPKDDVFTDNTLFTAIKENIEKTFGIHKDEIIFNRKGKPISIDEVLANVTEKEFFREFKCGGFFTKRYKEEKRIQTITLNNGCVIHYKPNPFNGKDAFKCFAGKHINVKNIRPFNFDEKQEHIYLLTNLREECYFVKVEKNESGLEIPSFKHCSELFLTAEDCEKYLEEAFENGVDTSGIYFSKLDLNRGDVRGYFKEISTGKLYSEYTEIDYVTPIPMDIEF